MLYRCFQTRHFDLESKKDCGEIIRYANKEPRYDQTRAQFSVSNKTFEQQLKIEDIYQQQTTKPTTIKKVYEHLWKKGNPNFIGE